MIIYETCKGMELGWVMFCGISIFFYHLAQWSAAWLCFKLAFTLLVVPVQQTYDAIGDFHDFISEHTKWEVLFFVCIILRDEYCELLSYAGPWFVFLEGWLTVQQELSPWTSNPANEEIEFRVAP
ncbi:hypothetical protein BKA65DRAFT_481174 [Rhexocercosporidium sp. MPI-PUGE-AT-0058]|nr:hypothetical protein BKA65DRAFT_481174 [Rhexocercosporidium sp. MPI-PUGE-AT-0058]